MAVVGASPRSSRPSHQVAAYLSEATDWQVWFVNPAAGSVLGQPTIPSLADLPAVPDLVDVFRRPEHLPGVVEAAIDVGASAVWFQLGLRHEAAAQRAVRGPRCRAGSLPQDRTSAG